MSYYLQENGTDRFLLEDGSGLLLIEADPALNADLSQTLGSLSATSAASVLDQADFSQTLGSLTLGSTASVVDSANLSVTLGLLTLAAGDSELVQATLDQTLGLLSLSSDATTVAIPPPSIGGGPFGARSWKEYRRLRGNLLPYPFEECCRRAEKIIGEKLDENEAEEIVFLLLAYNLL